MAMSLEQKYVKDYITRMVSVAKFVEGHTIQTQAGFNLMHKEVIKMIKSEYASLSANSLRSINKELASVMSAYIGKEFVPSITQIFKELTTKEVVWVADNISLYSGSKANILNPESVANKALKKTYQGHTFNFWFKSLETSNEKEVLNILKDSYVRGLPTDEAVKAVEFALGKETQQAKTLTRSYLQHASTESREQIYEANDDLIEEYVWLSTLDGRTTFNICGIRDGKRYTKDHLPIGHNLEWGEGPGRIHFNCRSTHIARIKGMPDVRETLTRAAINAGPEYESGDKWTKTGKVRKPTKANRDNGIFKVSQVSGKTSYEDYLRRQKKDFINDIIKDEDLTDKFKSGQISLYDVIMRGSSTDVTKL